MPLQTAGVILHLLMSRCYNVSRSLSLLKMDVHAAGDKSAFPARTSVSKLERKFLFESITHVSVALERSRF